MVTLDLRLYSIHHKTPHRHRDTDQEFVFIEPQE